MLQIVGNKCSYILYLMKKRLKDIKKTNVVLQVGVEDFANYSCHASNSLGRAKGTIQLRG
jgi:hypothetical protein